MGHRCCEAANRLDLQVPCANAEILFTLTGIYTGRGLPQLDHVGDQLPQRVARKTQGSMFRPIRSGRGTSAASR